MAVNPIQAYNESRQAKQNPVGYGIQKAYQSSMSNTDTYSPTGKTNLANSVRGYLSTGDFVGALVGLGANALSITGTKTNQDGSITKTTYATPFSMAAAYTNPIGFGLSTAYGAEMSKSTNYTATGHTNIANSILGVLSFGPIGAIVGALANLIGGLFGDRKSSNNTDTSIATAKNQFGSDTYTGFGSDKWGSKNITGYTGLSSGSNGRSSSGYGSISNTSGSTGQGLGYGSSYSGYSGYGSSGYTGFGSNSYGSTIGSNSNSSSSNGSKTTTNRSNTQPSYGNSGSNRGSGSVGGSSGSSSSSSSGYGSYGNTGGGRGSGGTQMGNR